MRSDKQNRNFDFESGILTDDFKNCPNLKSEDFWSVEFERNLGSRSNLELLIFLSLFHLAYHINLQKFKSIIGWMPANNELITLIGLFDCYISGWTNLLFSSR